MKLWECNVFTLVCDSVYREGEGLCLGGGKVSVWGHLSPGSLCLGTSLPKDFCPGMSLSSGVSVQWGLCPGPLCPGGSLSRGLFPGGLCPVGSLSTGVSVQGSLSSGVSIQGCLCPGGLCPGEFLSGRVLSLSWRPPVTVVERVVRILRNAFCSQEVRTIFRRCNLFNEVNLPVKYEGVLDAFSCVYAYNRSVLQMGDVLCIRQHAVPAVVTYLFL